MNLEALSDLEFRLSSPFYGVCAEHLYEAMLLQGGG